MRDMASCVMPNEIEMGAPSHFAKVAAVSHDRGVVANTSRLSLSGAIGFIVWLSAYVDYALTSMSEKRRADPMDTAIHYADVRPRA